MATKLKNLRISKVDFVDEGANPDAHIKLTKSKGEKGQSTGENGDKNGFVSRLFGFIGKKDRMRFELGDTMVEGLADTTALTDEEIQAAIDAWSGRRTVLGWKRIKDRRSRRYCHSQSSGISAKTTIREFTGPGK